MAPNQTTDLIGIGSDFMGSDALDQLTAKSEAMPIGHQSIREAILRRSTYSDRISHCVKNPGVSHFCFPGAYGLELGHGNWTSTESGAPVLL